MNRSELKIHLQDRMEDMSKILEKGKDIEVRKSRDGITIAEISKKVIKKE